MRLVVCSLLQFAVALPLSACSEPQHDASVPPATYTAVSESHWSLELVLTPDRTAVVVDGYCPPREGACTEETIHGTWSSRDRVLYLRYEGVQDQLEFHPELSLSDFGEVGELPGLQAHRSTDPDSRMRETKLWDFSKK